MEINTKIFLSYASEDREKVDVIYNRLQGQGYVPWQDSKDIVPGQTWERAIKIAIKHSDFFVACLSTHSVNKRGMVQKELKQALEIWRGMLVDDIYLIPIRLDDCDVPDDLKDNFHYVDVFKLDVWQEEGWLRLMTAIEKGLDIRRKS